jgi:oxygen-independent coproporphyrinogen-3 oxidase
MHPVLEGDPYHAYVYAYPHKGAYRPLEPRSLAQVWRGEPRDSLFLYVHIPFCTMRCGFCNLFTTVNPLDSMVGHYLEALDRQATAVRSAIPDSRFARFAIGGGTPTYLSEEELASVFEIAERTMGVDSNTIPVGIETSPDTLTPGKLAVMKTHGVNRVSIGVQSFIEQETASSGRPQSRQSIDDALALLSEAAFDCFNIDLIYGLPGQTVSSWLYSLREAIRFRPDELYLYPLYVRPLTGLGRSHKEWRDIRLDCYRQGRELLLANGYQQYSMRMFRRPGRGVEDPVYCCQEDGMVGLGCGARSYTRGLHYSFDYAVAPKSIKAIIADYLARTPDELASACHGFVLDSGEQRRRYLLQSILNVDGLEAVRYRERFGTETEVDFPDLHLLAELGLLRYDAGRWCPTEVGLERSDALGPWFFSERVQGLLAGSDPR